MTRAILPAAVALVLGAAPAEDVKREIDKFQGSWVYESVEEGGMKVPAAEIKEAKITFKGNAYTFAMGTDTREGTIMLYTDQRPMAIDRTATSGMNKGKTFKGIYTFDGDKLKLCWAKPGQDRPKDFRTGEDSPVVIEVLGKVK